MISVRKVIVVMGLAALGAGVATARQGGPGPKPIKLTPEPISLDAPLTRWDEGLPLGNGRIGALVWGGDNVIRISLDRGDLWDERVPETLQREDWTYATLAKLVGAGDEKTLHELFDVPYDTVAYPTKLPLGRVELTFPEESKARKFRLDLRRAEVTTGCIPARVRVHVSSQLSTIYVRVDTGFPKVRLIPAEGVAKLGYEVAKVEGDGELTWFVQKTASKLAYAVAVREAVDVNGTTFAIAIADNRDSPDALELAKASARIEPGIAYDQYVSAWHLNWWEEYWSKSKVVLPDARLQTQYDLAKYLYGAGSRAGGAPLALQGLWTADEGGLPPWKGDYHNDLNTQATYSAYTPAGVFDQGRVFLDFLWWRRDRFERFAKGFYGVQGLAVPGVMTRDGQAMGGWAQYSLSPTNGAWLAQSFYLHWRYTQDREFLAERAYPWCAGVGRALAALLVATPEGKLRLPLSSSPEIFDNTLRAWLPPNSNYDLALMTALFGWLEEMARELGQASAAEDWKKLAARLEPLDREPDNGSLTFARGIPVQESHRHFSHAMAIHPLGSISVEGPESERQVVEATLNRIAELGTKQWCGYSFSWFACMCARAARGDKALEYLEKYLSFTGRNGFHLNGDQSGNGLSNFTYRPFTLEGNFLAMQAVHEMLLQSWGGTLRVFPAVAAKWQDVSFEDLRAEGGYRVWGTRKRGTTTQVSIRATADGRLRLRDPFVGLEPVWNRSGVTKVGANYEVELKAGEQLDGKPAAAAK